ncbi:hypothetical protein IW261DRAFT_1558783 [Armillaria novae-zelandiae]|uniref:Survival Motor Neuron Gemin2-binding domain-containing protein n=1 Tax=Armillaria novae-zelandiae TaxID=153914 RepID=A0AA39PPC1_9AGAR|nr:hypothetical protein IW261DRAFT_1558783 [Armillaria novae-zelandiae]
MRPIVSYEDIAPAAHPDSQAPPAKKRKTNHKRTRPRHRVHEEELTHDEIWDDSALIDAWAAANEEYTAQHGPDKSWKDDASTDAEPTSSLRPLVSRDEAFERATSAMYWAGYWTAVYHRRLKEEEEGEEEVEVEENLVSTQR